MSCDLLINIFVQIVLIKSLTNCFVFLDDTLQVDDRCEYNATTYGICTFKCGQAEKDFETLGNFPKLCGINDGNLLFCCIPSENRTDSMENQNTTIRKLMDKSLKGSKPEKFYKEYDGCLYKDKIYGVCRQQCPNLKFPKYKLLLTEKRTCPVQEDDPPLECCVNHLQIAYPPEIFNLSNTFEEGNFCPYNSISIGICSNVCSENHFYLRPEKFQPRNSICSHKSDGTPIYCCSDYYRAIGEIVPFAVEGNSCKHQKSRWGSCKTECKKLEKFKRFGIIPTMCPHEPGKQQLYCCPWIDEWNELEKYRNASSGRTFYKKCQQYNKFKSRSSTYVAGGLAINYGDYPHMAAIGWTNSDGSIGWNCGGSLISDDYVITAAHCTLYNKVKPDVIRIGDQYLDKIEDPNNLPQNFTISEIINHPDYSYFSAYNDIALIKLNQTVTITTIVRPACLWNDVDTIDDEIKTISLGYGSTEFGGKNARKLLRANLIEYRQEECIDFYKKSMRSSLKNGIVDTQLCAGDPKGVQDTCQGDSGGPLEYNMNMAHFVYGITSVGQNCPSTVPGIYTRVSKYLDWIESVVWPNKYG